MSKRRMRDYRELWEEGERNGFRVHVTDSIEQIDVDLLPSVWKVSAESLVRLRMYVPPDYPFMPPRVFCLSHQGESVMDGAICHEALSPQGWSVGTTFLNLMIHISSLLETVHLGRNTRPFDFRAAETSFHKFMKMHKWN